MAVNYGLTRLTNKVRGIELVFGSGVALRRGPHVHAFAASPIAVAATRVELGTWGKLGASERAAHVFKECGLAVNQAGATFEAKEHSRR